MDHAVGGVQFVPHQQHVRRCHPHEDGIEQRLQQGPADLGRGAVDELGIAQGTAGAVAGRRQVAQSQVAEGRRVLLRREYMPWPIGETYAQRRGTPPGSTKPA